MNRRACILLACTLSALATRGGLAQGSFLERVHVRRSVDFHNEVKNPALLQMTVPRGERASILLQAGVSVDLIETPLLEVYPFVEYHRNTEVKREQDVLRGGGVAEWQVLPIGRNLGTHSPLLFGQLNAKRDDARETEAVQASLLYTHLFAGKGRVIPFPNTFHDRGGLRFFYAPQVGVEYESARANDSTDAVTRGVGEVFVAVYPFFRRWGERVETTVQYSFRRDLGDFGGSSDRTHHFVATGLNLNLLDRGMMRAGIGAEYVWGENPALGFESEEYLQVGFTFRH